MRYGTRFCFLVVFALVLMSVPLAAEAGSDSYTLVEIGEGYANAINDRGQVVGSIFSSSPEYQHAFVWDRKEGITNLHLALGWDPEWRSGADDINNRGQIVVGGRIGGMGPNLSVLIEPDRRSGGFAVTDLPEFPMGINNSGVVVGGEFGAYQWDKHDGYQPILNVANGIDINNRGQIVGWSSAYWDPSLPSPSAAHFVILEKDGHLTDIAAFEMAPGPPSVAPMLGGINDRGQVVYWVGIYPPGEIISYRWDPVKGVTAFEGVSLEAINNVGTMVGRMFGSFDPPMGTAPVVVDRKGDITVLPMPDGYTHGWATDINNAGVITGVLFGPGSRSMAVVWTR